MHLFPESYDCAKVKIFSLHIPEQANLNSWEGSSLFLFLSSLPLFCYNKFNEYYIINRLLSIQGKVSCG